MFAIKAAWERIALSQYWYAWDFMSGKNRATSGRGSLMISNPDFCEGVGKTIPISIATES